MAQEQQAQPEPDYSAVEEHFSDVFETHINPWSASVTFGYRSTRPTTEPTRYQIRMRMPLQQAKALAVLLLRGIRQYEEQSGADIDLPAQVLETLGVPQEDWQRFSAQ